MKNIQEIYEEDGIYSFEEIVEEGEWISEGKWEHKSTVVLFEGMHYLINESRSGSYFTDYYYDDPSFYEVEPIEVKKIEWKRIVN